MGHEGLVNNFATHVHPFVPTFFRCRLDLREPSAGVLTMMGSQGGAQDRLFYSFNLDDQVPKDHLLRGVDRFLDLSELRRHLASFYSHTGRPSIDPELMIRMLVIGYCFGIRSERSLCEEVHLNLAYRWFCGLDLGPRWACLLRVLHQLLDRSGSRDHR